ncbi:MAG: DUF192 domain-containing protein [Anaerolineales bacterium]|nr:DUF192 domain-containing protein [Anaerolineales bacterium]
MFRGSIPSDWGLLLVEKKDSIANAAIHMFFVPFDLGIIWINTAGEVVDTAIAKKWVGLKSPTRPARYILEVQPEHLGKFQQGDRIDFVKV